MIFLNYRLFKHQILSLVDPLSPLAYCQADLFQRASFKVATYKVKFSLLNAHVFFIRIRVRSATAVSCSLHLKLEFTLIS